MTLVTELKSDILAFVEKNCSLEKCREGDFDVGRNDKEE